MKTPATIITAAALPVILILVSQPNLSAQEQSQPSPDANSAASAPQWRPRIEFVKTVDFYLKDGRLISGRLLDQDASKIVMEQRVGSALKVTTYLRKDVDAVTMHVSSIPEYRFYDELGDYFAARTWDFQDDPDDFIAAARAYELAKSAAIAGERRQEDVNEIQEKLDKLRADKERWTEQMRDRAELKKLEFDATFDKKLKGVEDRIDRVTAALDETLGRFDAFAKQTSQNFNGLRKNASDFSADISRRMETLEQRVENNRRLIEGLGSYRYYRRYFP
jgi:hypothetical protein